MPEQRTTKPKSGPIREGEWGKVPYSAAVAQRQKGWIREGEWSKPQGGRVKRRKETRGAR
jgi:hypothetical protein